MTGCGKISRNQGTLSTTHAQKFELFVNHRPLLAEHIVKPSKRGHYGSISNINARRLSFVENCPLLGASVHYVLCKKINLGMKVLSFVERNLIHCPYLRMSSIGGFTVHTYNH